MSSLEQDSGSKKTFILDNIEKRHFSMSSNKVVTIVTALHAVVRAEIYFRRPARANAGSERTLLDKQGGVTKGFTHDELLTRIPEMVRLQGRGENIYYTPLSDDKHHILIDDMTAESLARFMAKGYLPAAVLESSPNNYQCILTIPKLQSAFDRDIGNRLTERLNKLYGDQKLSGCIHPHRAPAFSNLKSKHQRKDGTFPKVKLLEAKKQECSKAFALSRQILQEYEEAAKTRKAKTHPAPHVSVPLGSSATAYYVHYDNIRKHMAIEDFSRMDAMIALRMRVTGHSPQAVFDAMLECAPNILFGTRMKAQEYEERRDWQKYAERTANYAFSVAGDSALQKYEKYHEHWCRIEGAKSQEEQKILLGSSHTTTQQIRMR